MKVIFNQILTEKTDNNKVIKAYSIATQKTAKDNSTKWKQKEAINFNPERVDLCYPDITEMFDTCVSSNK